MSEYNFDIKDLVGKKLEFLRKKLIDLTMRNNQLNFKVKSGNKRSTSTIRIVDEVPEIIFEKIKNGKMELKPLPNLPETPEDENTPKFKNEYQLSLSIAERLEENELEDEEKEKIEPEILQYVENKTAAEERNAESEEFEKIDRVLKNAIREKLNLGPLEETYPSETSWAKMNKINPKYDLPLTKDISDERKYKDKYIQTLFFEDDWRRICLNLKSKYSGSLNETGVNNLRLAIGFLEYKSDEREERRYYAPILFQEIKIDKEKPKKEGGPPIFTITSIGDEISLNKTLELYLEKEHDIGLPNLSNEKYRNEDNILIDKFLMDIEKAVSGKVSWKVRRYMNI